MTVYSLVGRWQSLLLPITLVLIAVAAHALWCRLRHVRAPRAMLALDLTLWGAVMVLLSDVPEINAVSLSFLVLLAVFFSEGYWVALFVTYICGWYTVAYFATRPVDMVTTGEYVAIIFTAGALIALALRVKGWLGRLDANRSQMLGTVSHELRNNLTGILGLSELVKSESVAPEEVAELMGMVHNQAVDATEIVEDLLTVSRIERAALTIHLEPVDLGAEITTTARRFAGEGVTVSVDVEEGLPPASADALRVRQVLRNLISNAVRYGGPTIRVSARALGGEIEVSVTDDGDGVPVADITTIFLPYKRSTSTRRDSSSIGLGLWICRQLAHSMGGSLEYTRVDGDTSFLLTLRSHPVEAESRRHPQPARSYVPSTEGTVSRAVAVT
jgi:signal transduction histidine kinase